MSLFFRCWFPWQRSAAPRSPVKKGVARQTHTRKSALFTPRYQIGFRSLCSQERYLPYQSLPSHFIDRPRYLPLSLPDPLVRPRPLFAGDRTTKKETAGGPGSFLLLFRLVVSLFLRGTFPSPARPPPPPPLHFLRTELAFSFSSLAVCGSAM